MKNGKQILRSAEYQLRLLFGDRKFLALFLCMFVFMYSAARELREFLAAVGVKATPYLFPFMTSSPWLYMCMLIGLVPLMSEAPFYRKEELYLILREGRRKWILGNLLYCVCFSILYTLVLILISMLLLAGYLQPGLEWGKVWTTLAVTDTAEQIGLTVPVSQYVIFQYSPLQAMLLAALLNVLVNIFYSFLLWGLNLTTGRLVSIATVCASMCLVTRVMYLPDFVWYLTPAAWADLGSLYMNGPSNATVVKSVIRLLILNGVLGAYAYIRTLHADLGK